MSFCGCYCRQKNRLIERYITQGNVATGNNSTYSWEELTNMYNQDRFVNYSCFNAMVFSLITHDHLKKLCSINSNCNCCLRHQTNRPNVF